MAEVEGSPELPSEAQQDDAMAGEEGAGQGVDWTADALQGDDDAGDDATGTDAAAVNPLTVFLNYLKSPIVKLVVGSGTDETTLCAHAAVLERSPYLAEQLAALPADALEIGFPDETVETVGSLLQYQYTGEYFPRRLASAPEGLEADPSLPAVDDTGAQLLRHARLYTLAEKLGLPDLKTLAHSKIHRISSTAVGEIAYARYVYGHTRPDDATIRKPVAAFWATRSHVLRHEAEAEFKAMCLEFPQFGFDVLNLVLDQREKRARERDEEGTPGAGRPRKRVRPSVNI